MTKRVLFGLCAVFAVAYAAVPFAQEREDHALLTHDQMRAIPSEASGERAMHHVTELVPYPRIRPISEPQHLNAERAILLGQKKTALEFRDFLAGEFDPLPLADAMIYLRAREQAGIIRLVTR